MTHYNNQQDDLGIDLGGVSEKNDYAPLPPGKYTMQAINIELKDSKTGNGKYVSAEFAILDPNFSERKVFENYNIIHSNAQTVEIALKAIKQWVKAVGYTGDERLTMGLLKSLEGREFIGTLKIEVDKTGQYGDKSRIRAFEAVSGGGFVPRPAAAPAPVAPHQQPQQPQQAAGGAMPWAR